MPPLPELTASTSTRSMSGLLWAPGWRQLGWLGLIGLALALGACSTGSRVQRGADGPPIESDVNPMLIPDAEPKIEPINPGGANKPYEVLGQSYVPMTSDQPLSERGLASWYGRKFHGRRTASGETYNMNAMTAAHKTMPIPSYARVRNPANGREVIVRINDRGPFSSDRVIDLSWAAAVKLGVQGGLTPVEVQRLTHDEIRAGLPSRPTPAIDEAAAAVPAPRPALPTPLAATGPLQARAHTTDAVGYWLQLGAFSKGQGAYQFQQRVAQELDWLSPLLTVFAEAGVHRLQAGPYASREQAREAGERVRSALQLVPVIVERR